MDHKLPCIGTKIDAMPEIIEDGKTGFLVEVGAVEELERKIISLLEDKELMRRMGEEGFRRCKKRFTWYKVAERITTELITII